MKLDLSKEEIDYRTVVQKNPRNVEALFQFGLFLHKKQNRLKEAEEIYRQVLAIDAGYNPAILQLGVVRFLLMDTVESEARFRQLLLRDNNNPEVFVYLGLVLQSSRKRYSEAEQMFRQAIALEPQNTKALFNLGRVLEHSEQYFEAEVGCLN